MFDIDLHRRNYFYDLATVIEGLIPESICDTLTERVNDIIKANGVNLIKHQSLGTDAVSDLGGEYNHHIFKGDDIRGCLPELNAVYHALVPLATRITGFIMMPNPFSGGFAFDPDMMLSHPLLTYSCIQLQGGSSEFSYENIPA